MGKGRLKYYASQAKSTLKNAYLIIFCLSIAISMVAGVAYYSDSFSNRFIEENITEVNDYSFSYYDMQKHDNNSFLDADEIDDYKTIIQNIAENQKSLYIDEYFQLSIYSSENSYFYKNYTNVNTSKPIFGDYYFQKMNLLQPEENFYLTPNFNKFFKLIKGTFPKNEQEILVDVQFAKFMNFSFNNVYNLTICSPSSDSIFQRIDGDYQVVPSKWTKYCIENVKIVGIFGSLKYSYQFSNMNFRSEYEFDTKTNTYVSSPNLDDRDFVYNIQAPVFAYYNQSNFYGNSILTEFLSQKWNENSSDVFRVQSLNAIANHNKIDFNHISSTITQMQTSTEIIQSNLPDGLFFMNYLVYQMSYVGMDLNLIRIAFQLINFPILIFALIIGSFSLKIAQKSRIEEFLLLRSKGTPAGMIRNQILFEGFAIGTIASLAGSTIGIGVFYVIRNMLTQFLGLSGIELALSFVLTERPIITSLIVGIFTTQIASILSLIYIGKLHTNKLLEILGSDSMEAIYDEKSVFKKSKLKKIALEDTPFYSKNVQESSPHLFVESKGRVQNLKKSKRKKLFNRRRSLYKDSVSQREKKIWPISYLLLILSLIPVIFYFLYLGSLNSDSDIYQSLFYGLRYRISGIMFLFYFAPLLLVFAIIRFLALEKPSRFAKFTRKISRIIMKKDNKILALNMVRKKQYITTMFLIGIFMSLFIFSNIMLNSIVRYQRIEYNIEAGADAKITYSPEIDYRLDADRPGPRGLVKSGQDLVDIENTYKGLTNEDNETYIDDVLTIYRGFNTGRYNEMEYYLNLSKYTTCITEDGKDLISENKFSPFQEVVNYNRNPEDSDLGVAVNSKYLELNSVELGEIINIDIKYYDPNFIRTFTKTYLAKIISVVDLIPGISYYDRSYYSDYTCMLVDIDALELDISMMYGQNIIHMFDFNLVVEPNFEFCVEGTMNTTIKIGAFDNFDIYTYDNDWNSYNLDDVNIFEGALTNTIYSVLYLDFIAIGLIIAIGVAILLVFLRKADKFNQGVLLARGYGKKGVLKLLLTETLMVFTISLFTGIFSGAIEGIFVTKLLGAVELNFQDIKTPIFFKFMDILLVGLLIPVFSIIIYLLVYYFESKKNYTDYFHQF
ncbi:hypothetical protein NEF87_000851 [Candidatus Lokiarchaeum ossiferum]|uniref:ABC3 transporter permease C-terminal domain-containing protein n=1 Tax=Candidatus Lokiarchaeum ossiferum TaxID=2951803 RepID=A0ABY6HPU8_9ARCH|nr:hypothetical protein NEF87_000851 [Candidatus Lokiarchaeum sp. B-35]